MHTRCRQNNRVLVFGLLTALGLFSVSGAGRRDDLSGIWRSLGYGMILDIAGERVAVYQEVGGRVLESSVERARRAGIRLHFEIVPFAYKSEFECALAGNMLVLSELETGREIVLERIQEIPPRDSKTAGSRENFEYFAALFEELYPAFEERKVDWLSVTRRFRARLVPGMEAEELFSLFCAMLDEFGSDGHIAISDGKGNSYSPARRLATPMARAENLARQLAIIKKEYLGGRFEEAANGKILFSVVRDIGYLNILAVNDLAADASMAAQRASVNEALEMIRVAFAPARAIILDLRHNRGGFDSLSLMIAGLFADSRHVAFSKRIRIQGSRRFTEPRVFHVLPRVPGLSGKPLVLLTSRATASGAEILVLATMQFPQVRRFGAATMGVLSDTFVRELPNGWQVRLYSERYYAFDGSTFEAAGIPVHREIAHASEDLAQNLDPVLEAVFAELRK